MADYEVNGEDVVVDNNNNNNNNYDSGSSPQPRGTDDHSDSKSRVLLVGYAYDDLSSLFYLPSFFTCKLID